MLSEKNKKIRDSALREVKLPPDELRLLRFHCDDCPDVDKCDYAYDLYNAYGGRMINTGCLMMK